MNARKRVTNTERLQGGKAPVASTIGNEGMDESQAEVGAAARIGRIPFNLRARPRSSRSGMCMMQHAQQVQHVHHEQQGKDEGRWTEGEGGRWGGGEEGGGEEDHRSEDAEVMRINRPLQQKWNANTQGLGFGF